jgi:hypothetical protein
MRQFQVPQFITIEDKVIGPLTTKQAVYLGVGGVLIFFSCAAFTRFLCISTAVPIGTIAAALAFFKVNGQSFAVVLKNAFLYALHPRRYIWRKQTAPQAKKESKKEKSGVLVKEIPKISESRLSDLAWSLDIKHDNAQDEQ